MSGQDVLVPEDPRPFLSAGASKLLAESDTREDQSLQLVLNCLRQIAGVTAVEQHASAVHDAEAPGSKKNTGKRTTRKSRKPTSPSTHSGLHEENAAIGHASLTQAGNNEGDQSEVQAHSTVAQRTKAQTAEANILAACKTDAPTTETREREGQKSATQRTETQTAVQTRGISETGGHVRQKTAKQDEEVQGAKLPTTETETQNTMEQCVETHGREVQQTQLRPEEKAETETAATKGTDSEAASAKEISIQVESAKEADTQADSTRETHTRATSNKKRNTSATWTKGAGIGVTSTKEAEPEAISTKEEEAEAVSTMEAEAISTKEKETEAISTKEEEKEALSTREEETEAVSTIEAEATSTKDAEEAASTKEAHREAISTKEKTPETMSTREAHTEAISTKEKETETTSTKEASTEALSTKVKEAETKSAKEGGAGAAATREAETGTTRTKKDETEIVSTTEAEATSTKEAHTEAPSTKEKEGETTPTKEGGTEGESTKEGGTEETPTTEGGTEVTRTKEGGADVTPTKEGGTEVTPTKEGGTEVTPTKEGGAEETPTKEGGTEVTSTKEGGTEVTSTKEAETTSTKEAHTEATSTKEKAKTTSTTEGGTEEASTTEEGTEVASTKKDGTEVASTIENGTEVASTKKDGTVVASNKEDGTEVASITEDGTEVASTTEGGTEVASTKKDGTEVASTKEDGTEVASITEDGTEVASTTEGGTEVASTKKDGTEVASTKEDGTEVASTTEGGTEVASTIQAEATSTEEVHSESISTKEKEETETTSATGGEAEATSTTEASLTKKADTSNSTAEREVMFVLSQLDFQSYLAEPSYAEAACQLPRPADLKRQRQHRGDFDILVIHRRYGFLVGEIKSVGDNISSLSLTEQQHRAKVTERLKRAVKQLNKAESVVKHLVSDLQPLPRVQKCVMLPYVTSDYLRRLLEADSKLRQDLCRCVDVSDSEDPCSMCLTSDMLDTPDQWWQQRMVKSGTDFAMTDPMYLDLVSRFGGPATSVNVYCPSVPLLGCHANIRTEGEAVSETAWRFTRIVLHPRQLSIMRSDPPRAFLTGPPGTGKTMLLVLKGLEWLSDEHHVHVVSTWAESLPASHMIVSQLEQTAGSSAKERVHLHQFDLWRDAGAVETAVTTLVSSSGEGPVCVIVDEMGPDAIYGTSPVTDLCGQLLERLGNQLRLWAASVHHEDRPALLTQFALTDPLRTPPSVTRQVQESSSIRGGSVLQYTIPSTPQPCDGPAPHVVLHTGEGHAQGSPARCHQCGRQVARYLTHDLGVGKSGDSSDNPRQLRYRDVVLLVRYCDVHQTETDLHGNKQHVQCPLVHGLKDGGVPVRVVREGDFAGLADVARMEGPDEVVATWSGTMLGLERKIVVWTQYDRHWGEDWGRFLAMSRCTSQLVILKTPEKTPE